VADVSDKDNYVFSVLTLVLLTSPVLTGYQETDQKLRDFLDHDSASMAFQLQLV